MAMNQMQQMLARAQKMQRELQKAQAALAETEFKVSKAGIVEVVVMGDRSVKSISIDKDALEPDSKDMIEETIVLAINEALEKIEAENERIQEEITGQKGGLGF